MVKRSGRVLPRQAGFSLVVLSVLAVVFSVGLAAVLPAVSTAIRRDKEQELIFRGLQYAEAIRVFQARNGRYPVRLEELVEIRPRAARQLWADPMTKDGKWGLIYASAPGQAGQPGMGPGQVPGLEGRQGGISGSSVAPVGVSAAMNNSQFSAADEDDDDDGGDDGGSSRVSRRERQIRKRAGLDGTLGGGPIVGVHSLSDEEALKSFAAGGGGRYSDWRFTPDLLPSGGPTGENVPRLNSDFVGRPLPPGVEPGDNGLDEDDDLATDEDEARKARSERRRRRDRGGGG
jgi:type II secretory pathway pseudopilin PulG